MDRGRHARTHPAIRQWPRITIVVATITTRGGRPSDPTIESGAGGEGTGSISFTVMRMALVRKMDGLRAPPLKSTPGSARSSPGGRADGSPNRSTLGRSRGSTASALMFRREQMPRSIRESAWEHMYRSRVRRNGASQRQVYRCNRDPGFHQNAQPMARAGISLQSYAASGRSVTPARYPV